MEKPQSNQVLQKYRNETQRILEEKNQKASPEELAEIKMPKRANFRMRAHCNPLSDTPFPLLANKSS